MTQAPAQRIDFLVVAGEISGDLYAGLLVKHLKQITPSTRVWAVGGDALKQESDYFIAETVYDHAVGLAGVLKTMFTSPRWLNQLKHVLKTTRFKRVIVVDFQHYNTIIAALCLSHGIAVDTVITPNFWIWNDIKNAKKIATYSERIFTIFEPEYHLYQGLHPRVYYFGHPMVELVEPLSHPLPHPHRVTFFPGSRMQEMKLMVRPMVEIARHVHQAYPQAELVFNVSSAYFKTYIATEIKRYPDVPIQLWKGSKADLLNQTSVLVCASGSATLEGILYHVPMLMLAALPPITYFLAKHIMRLKLPYVTLPNLIASGHVVPEWVQNNIRPKDIATSVVSLIKDPEKAQNLLKAYGPIEASLKKSPRPFAEIAQVLLKSL